MKKRIDWKILIITTLMCIVPIIFGVILYNRLPDLFGIPLLMTALQIICCISSDCMEQKKQNKKYITIYKWIIPIIGMVCYLTMLAYGAGIELDMRIIVCITLGIIFMIIGNYMPKTEINKLQMYYVRKDFWEKVKRPAGYFFVIRVTIYNFSISKFNSVFYINDNTYSLCCFNYNIFVIFIL